jgi:hypothetical protein
MISDPIMKNAEVRAWEIALAATTDPLKQLPFEIAIVDNFLIKRLQNMCCKYNQLQFDRFTEKGYKLNLLTGEYEKPRS